MKNKKILNLITKMSTKIKILYFVLIAIALASVVVFAILYTSSDPGNRLVPILILVIGCGAPLVLGFLVALVLGIVYDIDKERNKIKKAEKWKFKKFSRLRGREKRLQMLQDKLQELESERDRPLMLPGEMLKAGCFETKEVNWAIAGGIASAMGGLGAGIMVAIETEAENERMRQKNSEDFKNVLSACQTVYMQNFSKYGSQIRALEEKIKEATEARINESFDTDKCFELLNCTSKSAIDATKKILSVWTTVEYQGDGNVDGCLLATIFANKKAVGKTLLVLPLEGVSRYAKVEGKIVLPYKFDEKTTYDIKITPYSLCLYE